MICRRSAQLLMAERTWLVEISWWWTTLRGADCTLQIKH